MLADALVGLVKRVCVVRVVSAAVAEAVQGALQQNATEHVVGLDKNQSIRARPHSQHNAITHCAIA